MRINKDQVSRLRALVSKANPSMVSYNCEQVNIILDEIEGIVREEKREVNLTINDIQEAEDGGFNWITTWASNETPPKELDGNNTWLMSTDNAGKGLYVEKVGKGLKQLIPSDKVDFSNFPMRRGKTLPLYGKIRRVMQDISAPGWSSNGYS